MLSRKILSKVSRPTSMRAMFGAAKAKEYDWRDDPKYNTDLVDNPRFRGWDVEGYEFPFQGHNEWQWNFPVRDYDKSDLTLVSAPENGKFVFSNTMPCSMWEIEGDIAHEADYESEDLDFQPDCFKTQHFKKRGPIWPWFIVGVLPIIYMFVEFLVYHYPDEEHWRKPLPPPLDYPNQVDTPDTNMYQYAQTAAARSMVDTGLIHETIFDIVDGKKVYKEHIPINKPMTDI